VIREEQTADSLQGDHDSDEEESPAGPRNSLTRFAVDSLN
jgi:hypothetical protein